MTSRPDSPHQPLSDLELQFPTLPVQHNNKMDFDSASDATHDSLADSAYEIISQSSLLPSDANSQPNDSASIASSPGAATPDDTGSDVAPEMPEEVESSWIYPQDPTEVQEVEPVTPHVADPSTDESSPRNIPSVQSSTCAPTVVHSPETSLGDGYVQVARTLPGQIGSDVRGFGRRHDNDNEHFTTRCTLTPHSLTLTRPFRIVYHGDAAYESRILDKVAEALAVSSVSDHGSADSHTRHSLVRTSWYDGDVTQPSVTMLPSLGIELITDRCHVCSSPSHVLRWTYEQMATGPFGSEKTGQYSPKTESGRIEELHEHQESVAAAEKRPDLAIYFHSSSVGSAPKDKDASKVARPLFESSAFTKSLGIPTLDISDTVLEWEAGPFKPYRDQAVHMCLENARASPSCSDRIICRMPVDLDHFLQLDPGQLNRNIACISKDADEEELSWSNILPSCFVDARKSFRKAVDALREKPLSAVSLLSIAALVMVMLLSSNLLFDRTKPNFHLSPAMTSLDCLPSTSHASSVPSSLGRTHTEKGLSVVPSNKETEVNIFTASPHSSSLEWPGGLGLRLLQDQEGRTYLNIPKKLSRMRHTPDFFISASAKGKELLVNLEKCNASAWAVDFRGEDKAHPRIEVIVWTKTSPLLRQAFLIERPVSWYGRQQIESAVSVYVASSKALSRVAAQELDVYRKHATGLIQHSSSWIQKSFLKAHETSQGLLEQVMDNQAAEIEVWQKLLSDSLKTGRANTAAAWEESLQRLEGIWSQRSQTLESVGNGLGGHLSTLGRELTNDLAKLQKRAHAFSGSFKKRSWRQMAGFESTILKASNRAKSLREKISASLSAEERGPAKLKGKIHHKKRESSKSHRHDTKGGFRQR